MKKKLSKQVTVGVDPYTGKRIRKRVYGNSTTGLRQAEHDLIRQTRDAENPSDVKFGPYSEEWLAAYKSSREAKTVSMYRSALNKTKPISQKKIKNIREIDLQLLIKSHEDHPTTCSQLRLTLNQIFKRAVKDGIISRNPAEDLELPKKEETEQRKLTKKEIKAIKAADLDDMERMYISLLYYFGLRPQEALALMPQDFDFQHGELTIRRAVGYDGETPYIKSTKTYKIRRIPIPGSFVPEAKEYIRKLKKEKSLYLLHQDGQIMTHRQKSDFWTNIKSKINTKLGGTDKIDMTNGLRPYTFRHNFCCDCYYKKISILKTAELMGNSPEMVMKRYTHLDNEQEPLEALKRRCL